MENTHTPAGLHKALEKYTTLRAFAGDVGVTYQVVQQWLKNGVPAEYCPTIEKLTGVRSEDLNSRVDWAFIRNSSHRKRDHITA